MAHRAHYLGARKGRGYCTAAVQRRPCVALLRRGTFGFGALAHPTRGLRRL